MKKTRFVAIATAAAVAAGGIVPANAAQIGPLDQNKCKVTFTAAEREHIYGLFRTINAQIDDPVWRDLSLSLEAAYPGIRPVGDDFVNDFHHQLNGHKTRKAFNDALNSVPSTPYERRLHNMGLSEGTAAIYLIFRANAAYGANLIGDSKGEIPDLDNAYVEAALKNEDFDANLGGLIFGILFAITTIIDDADAMTRFYNTFDKTQSGRVFAAANPALNAHGRAAELCLGGGNGTVAYPTGKSTSAPSNPKPSNPKPSKPSGNQQTPAKPSNPAPNNPSNGTQDTTNQGTTNQGTTNQGMKDEGSSTAGIVIGVIAAVLAIIGIAAAAAPALGLQIPGRG